MKKFSRSIWYCEKARRSFQRRRVRQGVSFLKKLVLVSPCKAIMLVVEAAFKILVPLRLRSAALLGYKRTFRVTPPFYRETKGCGINSEPRDEKVAVTLTSYPKRIGTVHKTINTLLNQTYRPDLVVLWLAPEQFPNRENDLPKQLLRLREYGLTIDWCRDIRSFKKLIPSLKKYPDALLVTADDDIYYPPDWLEKLVVAHRKYPKCVICHGAHRIRFGKDGALLPYRKWKFGTMNCVPSFDLFVTCGAGALYAPGVLHEDVTDESRLEELCPFADDIWFWAMAVLNNSPIKVVDNHVKRIHPIYEADNSSALATLNMMEGNRNDIQLAKVLKLYPQIIAKLRT